MKTGDTVASDTSDLEDLQVRLGIHFEDQALIQSALTHRSYAFEHGGVPHNERLEFLGDAVLGLIVTDMIYAWFPELPEGEMAKLRASTVNTSVLAESARKLELGNFLFLGKGEDLSGGRNKNSILADTFEALLGAIYLDHGTDVARAFIEESLGWHIRDHVERGVVRDFKTSLQEETARRVGLVPEYRILSAGPDHAKRFKARVFVQGRELGEGEGRSKKEAEQAAAKEALAALSED